MYFMLPLIIWKLMLVFLVGHSYPGTMWKIPIHLVFLTKSLSMWESVLGHVQAVMFISEAGKYKRIGSTEGVISWCGSCRLQSCQEARKDCKNSQMNGQWYYWQKMLHFVIEIIIFPSVKRKTPNIPRCITCRAIKMGRLMTRASNVMLVGEWTDVFIPLYRTSAIQGWDGWSLQKIETMERRKRDLRQD